VRHARNAAVEAIENECYKNCQCSLFKTTVHRLHDREETGKKRNRRQRFGSQYMPRRRMRPPLPSHFSGRSYMVQPSCASIVLAA